MTNATTTPTERMNALKQVASMRREQLAAEARKEVDRLSFYLLGKTHALEAMVSDSDASATMSVNRALAEIDFIESRLRQTVSSLRLVAKNDHEYETQQLTLAFIEEQIL